MRETNKESVDNIGIMQGFLDMFEDAKEDDGEEGEEGNEGEGDESSMERRPDSPEILMNNLRGDMRSIDARRDELADLVGYAAASETPEPVLAMLQPILAQQGGLGALPQSGPMAQGPQPPMGGLPGMPPGGAPAAAPSPPQQGGIAELPLPGGAPPEGMSPPTGMPPVGMAHGGLVQRFQEGSDEEGVTPVADASSGAMYDPTLRDALRARIEQTLAQTPKDVPSIEALYTAKLPTYRQLLGENQQTTQAQMLFDLGQRALGYAANVDERGRPMRGSQLSRLAGAFQGLPATIGARVAEFEKGERAIKTAALSSAEKEAQRIQELNQRLQQSQDRLLGVLSGQAVKETADERRDRLQRDTLAAKANLEDVRQQALNLRAQLRSDTQRFSTEVNNLTKADMKRQELENKLQTTTMSLEAKQVIANELNQVNLQIANMRDALGREKIGSTERIEQARNVNRLEQEAARIEGQLKLATLNNEARSQLQADRLAVVERLAIARNELEKGIADDRNLTSRLNTLDNNARALQVVMERGQASMMPGFGKGLTGTQLNIFTQLAPSFAANTLGENGDRMFEAAVTDYINRNTSTTTDPVTGERLTRTVTLPRFVITALQARDRGDLIPQQGPVAMPAAGGIPSAAPGAVPGPQPAPGTQPPPGRRPLDTRPLSLSPEEQANTFFNLAGKGTGPIAVGAAMISKFPGLGDIAPDQQTATTFLRVAANQINRSLSVGDRFTESERKQIQDQLDALPQFIDNPTAYRNRLLGLDNLLGSLEQRAIRSYNSPTMNVADIRKAAANFEEVRNLRAQLGMPPRIENNAEGQASYNALPAGAYFIFNGTIRQKNAPR